jgi:peptidoglycan/LPS O-acetylase OafA/YrhL
MTGPRDSSYRPDIDGLRAVAVLSVLLFHAFPAALTGGFVGVDIFFVISGYLISQILLGQLERGTFTFRDFYARRIRRIFPALLLVLAATIAFGWVALLPADFESLGLQIAAGAGFASNLLLWRETGEYFATSAELKPLLHLWSLGVEEQYYLLWPLLLFVLRSDRRHRIMWLIVALWATSFALSIYLVERRPIAAFYLPQSRFWELMTGSLVAYLRTHGNALPIAAWLRRASSSVALRNAAVLTGGAALLAALLVVNEERAFPGWWALLPTAGSALLIAAGPASVLNRAVLATRGLVYVGLISYPLYLWHWPLLAYARILGGGDAPPSAAVRAALLVAAFVLACATYELVEKRVRHLRPARFRPAVVGGLASGVAAVAGVGLLAFSSYAQSRSANEPELTEISAALHDWDYGGDSTLRGDSDAAVVFIGDSHLQQFLPRVVQLMDRHDAPVHTVVFKTRGGCGPIPGLARKGRDCAEFAADAFAAARAPDVETVIVGASWTGLTLREDQYRSADPRRVPLVLDGPVLDWALIELETALAELVAAGKRVLVVLSVPRSPRFDPSAMVQRAGLGFEVRLSEPVPKSELRAVSRYMDDRVRAIAARVGAGVIDPVDAICDASTCAAVDERGHPLYKDDSHLRPDVARERFEAFDRYVYLADAREVPDSDHSGAAAPAR